MKNLRSAIIEAAKFTSLVMFLILLVMFIVWSFVFLAENYGAWTAIPQMVFWFFMLMVFICYLEKR